MTILLIFALTLIPASIGFADPPVPAAQQAGPTSGDKPDAELLDLEKQLTREQEAKGPDQATPEQYKAYVVKFRATLGETMARIAPTPANQSVHARILVRLGDSSQALADLNAAPSGQRREVDEGRTESGETRAKRRLQST